jgi:hypothetical protein
LQRDGVVKRAGDGTRTRDSLLGRQVFVISPLVSYELASGEASATLLAIDACPTKVFTSHVGLDHLPLPICKHLPSWSSDHLPPGFSPSEIPRLSGSPFRGSAQRHWDTGCNG